MTVSQADKAKKFRALHEAPGAFVIANPWDAGSARVLAGLGFQALATSSGAKAGVLGKRDGKVTREEALANARMIVEACDLPVSADLEKGFGDAPDAAAETIRQAAGVGLVGGSIEDATGDKDKPLFDLEAAAERVAAAVKAAPALPFPFVLTARAEGFLRGKPDLDDVIRRLQAFEAAGADVLMAPGLPDLAAVKKVCELAQASRSTSWSASRAARSAGRARGRGREAHQPRHLALPRGHDRAGGRGQGGQGEGHLHLPRPLDPDARSERLHEGVAGKPSLPGARHVQRHVFVVHRSARCGTGVPRCGMNYLQLSVSAAGLLPRSMS